jgi:hypothetical protein
VTLPRIDWRLIASENLAPPIEGWAVGVDCGECRTGHSGEEGLGVFRGYPMFLRSTRSWLIGHHTRPPRRKGGRPLIVRIEDTRAVAANSAIGGAGCESLAFANLSDGDWPRRGRAFVWYREIRNGSAQARGSESFKG